MPSLKEVLGANKMAQVVKGAFIEVWQPEVSTWAMHKALQGERSCTKLSSAPNMHTIAPSPPHSQNKYRKLLKIHFKSLKAI